MKVKLHFTRGTETGCYIICQIRNSLHTYDLYDYVHNIDIKTLSTRQETKLVRTFGSSYVPFERYGGIRTLRYLKAQIVRIYK